MPRSGQVIPLQSDPLYEALFAVMVRLGRIGPGMALFAGSGPQAADRQELVRVARDFLAEPVSGDGIVQAHPDLDDSIPF